MGFTSDSDNGTGRVSSVLARSFGFARDGVWDKSAPSAALATALEDAAGPDLECRGATRDEMVGMLRQCAAVESWVAAMRLGVLRGLLRTEGGLPGRKDKSLAYEASLALAVSVPTAESMLSLAGDLGARLPGIGALLAGGILSYAKARAVDEVFALLSPEDAAAAQALILEELAGKNYGQVLKLAQQAAITVDPDSAARRREHAEKERARVQLFREDSGAAGLSGRDLPTDQALAADARVNARARQYKDSGAFPSTPLGCLRAVAYLDLLNGISADARIGAGLAGAAPVPDDPGSDDPGSDDAGPDDDGPSDDPGPDDNGPDDNGPGDDRGPDAPRAGDGPNPSEPAVTPLRLPDLILPLATLLGLAQRPGQAHGLGPLDPDLCRAAAAAAAASPYSRFCITITDEDGIAVGHGCAKPARKSATAPSGPIDRTVPQPPLPARVNLTIPASRLDDLARQTGPPGQASWSFTRNHDPGPPGDSGRWTITLPTGQQLTIALESVPTFACDHRHESHAYQPNDKLRHLVQVRDYECTFPQCSRHARDSDFEHAVPYDKGGRTCACNAGARSRACHRVKQSRGWKVTQPRPGWHQWETPAGRVYVQGPKRYPA